MPVGKLGNEQVRQHKSYQVRARYIIYGDGRSSDSILTLLQMDFPLLWIDPHLLLGIHRIRVRLHGTKRCSLGRDIRESRGDDEVGGCTSIR
ncbi:hypothetical protein PAXRUDRAFT_336037 [Paxillus rubicundulus Ve08.2h10]|uniref:Uncharacterized protein n=1 Tax=Paxillus rubicundulus Ve08.2h10 TaxID=930991 RepID=A0A0D0C544_9AGAM|nr:hypothetical protein PAXRUDRAFT_336037 [Paxillus rubicundulus Ve08.2h10]